MQETTQNRLASPTTLGTAAGAWLALVVASIAFPAARAEAPVPIAMAGGLAATAVVLALAGLSRMDGIVTVVIGMAMNILLGGLATVLVLLNGEVVKGLFVWGAGDLTQTGWDQFFWLVPQVSVAGIGLFLLNRPLAMMRTGAAAARGLGLRSTLFAAVVLSLSVTLTASCISAVGVIGFVGLIAGNVARAAGVRRVPALLAVSTALGSVALLATDIVPVALSDWSKDLIPSGSSAALFGPVALIAMIGRHVRAKDHARFQVPFGAARPARWLVPGLATCLVAVLASSLLLDRGPDGFGFGPVSDLALSLRLPRIVAAAGAGIAISVAGLLLQRLLKNPLASPDIIGITSGASLGVVFTVVILGMPFATYGYGAALVGAGVALLAIILLGWRTGGSSAHLVLAGICLSASLDALVRFLLARGGDDAYALLTWLSGTTFRATAAQSLMLLAVSLTCLGAVFALRRWLTLLSFHHGVESSRGLNAPAARTVFLLVAASCTAAVTAIVGPVTFVGLVAPHAATLLGARRVTEQLVVASLLGTILFVLADLAGRALLYPEQIPAGAIVLVIGGAYLFMLIVSARRRTPF